MKGVVKRESKGQRIFSSRDTDIIRGDWSPSLPQGKKSDSAESINEPAVYTALMSRLNIEPFTSSERTPRGRGAARLRRTRVAAGGMTQLPGRDAAPFQSTPKEQMRHIGGRLGRDKERKRLRWPDGHARSLDCENERGEERVCAALDRREIDRWGLTR